MASLEDQRKLFDAYCKERFDDSGATSKTSWGEKETRIVNVLKDDPAARSYTPAFKFWVKKRGFQLIS